MKAAVALVASVALLAGCFPNNPRARTFAKYAEGAALISGIAISAVANTGADCDEQIMPGPNVDNDCRRNAKILGTVGLLLILGGLLGFVATISTAEDQELKAENAEAKKQAEGETSGVKLPPGVDPKGANQTPPADGAGAGSATPTTDVPPAPAGEGSATAPTP